MVAGPRLKRPARRGRRACLRPGRRRTDPRSLRGEIDALKQRLGSGVAALVGVNGRRGSVAVGVTDDLAAQVSAVELVKAAVEALGGQAAAAVRIWPRAAARRVQGQGSASGCSRR
jgi:alanyl-tRNA synthetase